MKKMSRVFSVLLSLALMLGMLGVPAFAAGAVSTSDIQTATIGGEEYLIFDSAEDFVWLRNHINNQEDGADADGRYYCTHNILLTADIDMTGYNDPAGIGSSKNWTGYSGIFDGGGHTISNLAITGTDAGPRALLFNLTKDATIQNVALQGTVDANRFIGGVVGRTLGSLTLENVVVDAALTLSDGFKNAVGGLIGQIGSGKTTGGETVQINNCAALGTYTSDTSTDPVGGLIGYIYGGFDVTISNSYTAATLSCTDGTAAGLIAGQGTATLQIQNCYYPNTYAPLAMLETGDIDADPVGPKDLDDVKDAIPTVLPKFQSPTFALVLNGDFIRVAGGYPVPKVIGGAEDDTLPDTVTAAMISGEKYLIFDSAEDMAWLGTQASRNNILLTADLDMTNGTVPACFSGIFDGGGHVISNLKAESTGTYPQGLLFQTTTDAAIRNLAVQGTGTVAGLLGGLVGSAEGSLSLESVLVNAVLNSSSAVGGLIGQAGGTLSMTNCAAVGDFTGGLIGMASDSAAVSMTNSYAAAAGGTAGLITAQGTAVPTVTNCYYLGTDGASADGATAKTETEMKSADFVTALGGAFAADNAASPLAQGYPVPSVFLHSTGDSGDSGDGGGAEDESLPAYITTTTIDGVKYLVFDSVEDMEWLREHINAGGDSAGCCTHNIYLTADLDMAGHNGTTEGIGSAQSSTCYSGIFNGNGHTISNLEVTGSNAGPRGLLFNYTKDATIQNVAVQGTLTSDRFIGGLVGRAESSLTLKNDLVNAVLTLSNSNSNAVGGLIGQVGTGGGGTVLIKNCAAVGSFTSGAAASPVGGLIGQASSGYAVSIVNSYAAADLTCPGNYVAGLIANQQTSDLTIANCYYLDISAEKPLRPDGSTVVDVTPKNKLDMQSEAFLTDLRGFFSADGTPSLAGGYPVPIYAGEPVALIGEAEYATLTNAIARVKTGDTVILVSDAAEDVTIPAGVDITLDLNGKTLTGTEDNFIVVYNFGALTIQDSAGGGRISAPGIAVATDLDTKLTITGGVISAVDVAVYSAGGTVSISGDDTRIISTGGEAVLVEYDGSAAITGGTFSSDVTNYVVDGYKVVGNTDGTYTVTLRYVAYVARDGDSDPYETLDAALKNAVSGDTVILLTDIPEVYSLIVPPGVTLDLSGMSLHVSAAVVSFGDVIDSSDGKGGLYISSDTATAAALLQSGNSCLPIYDADAGCYRLFRYQLNSLLTYDVGMTNAVQLWFQILFQNYDAYALLGKGSDVSKVEIAMEMTWDGLGHTFSVVFGANELKNMADYAAEADHDMSEYGLYVQVTRLDRLPGGSLLSGTPTVRSTTTDAAQSSDTLEYTTAVAG